jgi:hypothetical protein
MVFDFGTREEEAQQARHKLDTWRQAFHLNKKLEYKFERQAADGQESSKKAEKGANSKGGSKKNEDAAEAAEPSDDIRVIVKLSFSDHEKLSSQRWLDRIPGEEPFKAASPKIVRHGEADFAETDELFNQLD